MAEEEKIKINNLEINVEKTENLRKEFNLIVDEFKNKMNNFLMANKDRGASYYVEINNKKEIAIAFAENTLPVNVMLKSVNGKLLPIETIGFPENVKYVFTPNI